jgi:hypothetical protein
MVMLLAGCAAPGASASPQRSVDSPAPSPSTSKEADINSHQPSATPSDGLIVTESAPRDPELAGCTTQGEFEIVLVLKQQDDTDAITGVLTDPSAYPEFSDGFPAIIWPFGFSAEAHPQVVILDQAGKVVATEDQTVRLAGGTIDDVGYHVCLIDGVMYVGAAD